MFNYSYYIINQYNHKSTAIETFKHYLYGNNKVRNGEKLEVLTINIFFEFQQNKYNS